MPDLDIVTGTVAARLRTLPEVARLYPNRTLRGGVVRTAQQLLSAIADDPAVAVRSTGSGIGLEVSAGVTDAVAAPEAAAAIAAAARRLCDEQGVRVDHVRVRIASIE